MTKKWKEQEEMGGEDVAEEAEKRQKEKENRRIPTRQSTGLQGVGGKWTSCITRRRQSPS
jgi:hypothetical protein